MANFEITYVKKHYNFIDIEAENEEEAMKIAEEKRIIYEDCIFDRPDTEVEILQITEMDPPPDEELTEEYISENEKLKRENEQIIAVNERLAADNLELRITRSNVFEVTKH